MDINQTVGRPIQIALLHLLVQFLVTFHSPDLASARPDQFVI